MTTDINVSYTIGAKHDGHAASLTSHGLLNIKYYSKRYLNNILTQAGPGFLTPSTHSHLCSKTVIDEDVKLLFDFLSQETSDYHVSLGSIVYVYVSVLALWLSLSSVCERGKIGH